MNEDHANEIIELLTSINHRIDDIAIGFGLMIFGIGLLLVIWMVTT